MNRFTKLLIANLLTGALVGFFVFWTLYNTSLDQISGQLKTTVESEKNIMMAVAEFNQQQHLDIAADARPLTLSQFEKAHSNFETFGETGEFTVAEIDGGNIKFIFKQRHSSIIKPDSIPLSSALAEPMRRALRGESGVTVGLDYRGHQVLAAYAPVDILGVGLVAKMDLSEIRQPFIEVALYAILVSFLLFSTSAAFFIRVLSPVNKELKESEKLYRDLIEEQSELVCRSKIDGTIIFANQAYLTYFGKKQNELLGVKFTEFIPQDQRKDLLNILKSLSSAHRSSTHEHLVTSLTGKPRWIQWTNTLIRDRKGKYEEIISVGLDITDKKQDRIKLERISRAQAINLSIHDAIVGEDDPETLMSECCKIIVEQGLFVLAWIGRTDDNAEKTVTPISSYGEGKDYLNEIKVTWGDEDTGMGPVGSVIKTKKSIAFQHLETDANFEKFRAPALAHGYNSILSLPMLNNNRVTFTLNVYSAQPDAFDEEETILLETLAKDLCYGLTVIQQKKQKEVAQIAVVAGQKNLKESFISTISALAHTLGQRDPYTAGHQEQVAALAVAIAAKMGMSDNVIEGIMLGATIHDIGKVSIPAEILTKPSRLTELEFELIKTHAENGYNIVKDIEFEWPIDKVIYQHHERLDGSGYPQGLKGDEICIEARIVAVADVVDAITSHRPYRPGKSMEFALNEIVSNSGNFYDPDVVTACVSVINEDGYFSKKKID